MALESFVGDTFVAFTDISGFKQLMRTPEKATSVLRAFYYHGYHILQTQGSTAPTRVEGLFVSDCAVLFVRSANSVVCDDLKALLVVIESINHEMLKTNIMLSTSIAYGEFMYRPSYEFDGIEKNLIVGHPYLEAYLDQSAGQPKLEPGQCRLLNEHIPPEAFPLPDDDQYFLRLRADSPKHRYFYWMCRGPQDIEDFERQYRDAYNLKYGGMLNALKAYALNSA